MIELTTTRDVIKVLGGNKAAGAMTGRSRKAPVNWKREFPADTYHAMKCQLEKLGYTAPPSLWRQVECKE